jgi:NADH-quinone oxidoreductase subunit J
MESAMLPSFIVFGILALVAIATAVAMLVTRQPVFAVLFLVMNFITVAVLYLILGAPFIAFAQITVYAGAIMVLFLFVVMMLGTEKMSFLEPLKGQRWLAGLLAGLFVVLIGIFLFTQMGGFPGIPAPQADFGNPMAVGSTLMAQYVLPILIIGLILLAATIGAVVLTHRENPQDGEPPQPQAVVEERKED